MSEQPWIIVKRTGQEVEIVHWGVLPEYEPIKLRAARCPTCGGTDREGGAVIIAGPDENGQYDTDDCPDDFHAPSENEKMLLDMANNYKAKMVRLRRERDAEIAANNDLRNSEIAATERGERLRLRIEELEGALKQNVPARTRAALEDRNNLNPERGDNIPFEGPVDQIVRAQGSVLPDPIIAWAEQMKKSDEAMHDMPAVRVWSLVLHKLRGDGKCNCGHAGLEAHFHLPGCPERDVDNPAAPDGWGYPERGQ